MDGSNLVAIQKTIERNNVLNNKIFLKNINKLITFIYIYFFLTLVCIHSCSKNKDGRENEVNESAQQISKNQKPEKKIITIKSLDHFQRIIEQGGNRLFLFDLYADWCQPCRILTPILEEIAEEKSDIVSFYKVDVDKHRIIAKMLQVRTIPLVVLIKNKNVVKRFVGVQPKTAYLDGISEYAN